MVSTDDLNDWAKQAAELDELMQDIDQALLDENLVMVGEWVDCARPLAHLLLNSMVRAGAMAPTESRPRGRLDFNDYFDITRTDSSVRAAEALERAALLVLALEKEYEISAGMGDVLADFAAELNLRVFGGPEALE